MKKELSLLFEFISKQIDGYLLPNEIKDFVLKKYGSIDQKVSVEKNIAEELNRINENLITLGWIEGTKTGLDMVQNNYIKNSKEAIKWANSLDNGKIIDKGMLSAGTGFFLDVLDERGGKFESFTIYSIETLLNYVEVNRKKIPINIVKGNNFENDILQWIAISILFCHSSRRHKDLRFLNTVLKMNDMFFPMFRNEKEGRPLVNFLCALTEQEISIAELLK